VVLGCNASTADIGSWLKFPQQISGCRLIAGCIESAPIDRCADARECEFAAQS
jgi:hypothetical protein